MIRPDLVILNHQDCCQKRFSSNGTSSFHKNEVKAEIMDSKSTECVCNLPIGEKINFKVVHYFIKDAGRPVLLES
jgi:hypothetical protein